MKKPLILMALAAFVITGGYFGIRSWREHVVLRLEKKAYAEAELQLTKGNPLAALAIHDSLPRTDVKLDWSSLEVRALTAGVQIPRLVSMQRRFPERLQKMEDASLLVARALFAARRSQEYGTLRDSWRGRERKKELWLALDSDILGLEGKPQEAEALLSSMKFEGEAESIRLVRLALHSLGRDPYRAWTLLDRACALSPRNPEVHSFRAQMLESIGKTAEARVEYVAALASNPGNPLFRDELAEFYKRQHAYDLALQTWRETSTNKIADFISLKEATWSRLVQPKAGKTGIHSEGPLGALADFVASLPSGRFWDQDRFELLPGNAELTAQRQEVFWLQLLELLRLGREQEAAAMLGKNRFRNLSWHPELEAGLTRILAFRTRGTLMPPEGDKAPSSSSSHPFLLELEGLAKKDKANRQSSTVPIETARFLRSDDAIPGAFMAAGWREAVILLAKDKPPHNVPVWFSFGFAQCLRVNRGGKQALDYLAGVPPSPELRALKGELLLGLGRTEHAVVELESVARDDSDAGYRSAWILAQRSLEMRDLARTEKIVSENRLLRSSVAGQELLAGIHLASGKVADAEKIYRSILEKSIEAKTFFARKAFGERDWSSAKRHTTALIKVLPDSLELRENLIAIATAERQHENR